MINLYTQQIESGYDHIIGKHRNGNDFTSKQANTPVNCFHAKEEPGDNKRRKLDIDKLFSGCSQSKLAVSK